MKHHENTLAGSVPRGTPLSGGHKLFFDFVRQGRRVHDVSDLRMNLRQFDFKVNVRQFKYSSK